MIVLLVGIQFFGNHFQQISIRNDQLSLKYYDEQQNDAFKCVTLFNTSIRPTVYTQ